MKRILSYPLALGLIGAASAGTAVGVAGAATHHPAAAMPTAGVTMFQPRSSSKVTGAIAMLNGTGAMSGAGAAGRAGETTVAILIDGLQASSVATARVFAGACGSDRTARYALPPLRANAVGDATGVTALTGANIALSGIHVNIYGAPGARASMSGATGGATAGRGAASVGTTNNLVACGNIHQPGQTVQIKPAGRFKASALGFVTPNQPVLGTKVKTGTEVIVYATGLQPNVAQAEHIHAGPCSATAPVQYPLLDLVADRAGRAIAGTGVTDMVPMSGTSLHIHATNWAMEACGDLGAAGATGMGGMTGGAATGTRTPTAARTATTRTTPTALGTPARGGAALGTATARQTSTAGGAARTPTARPTTKP